MTYLYLGMWVYGGLLVWHGRRRCGGEMPHRHRNVWLFGECSYDITTGDLEMRRRSVYLAVKVAGGR